LRCVEASLQRLDYFATTNLSFLKTENCESDCGVPDFCGLLDNWVLQNSRGVDAAEVDIGEIDGM
jgi:hypothetical protein